MDSLPLLWVILIVLEALSLGFVVSVWRRPGRLGPRLGWSAALLLLPVLGPLIYTVSRAFDETLGSPGARRKEDGLGSATDSFPLTSSEPIVTYTGPGSSG